MAVATLEYNYIYTDDNVKESSSIVFGVKGTRDAHVGLFSDIKSSFINEPFYEIFIGGSLNTRLGIRKAGLLGSSTITIVTSSNVLSSSELRFFWLTWANHNFSFGTGEVIGQQTLYNQHDLTSPMEINHLALASYHGLSHTWKYHNGL